VNVEAIRSYAAANGGQAAAAPGGHRRDAGAGEPTHREAVRLCREGRRRDAVRHRRRAAQVHDPPAAVACRCRGVYLLPPCPHASSSSVRPSAPATSAPHKRWNSRFARPIPTPPSATWTSSPHQRRLPQGLRRGVPRPRQQGAARARLSSTTTWTSRAARRFRATAAYGVERLNLTSLCDLLECEQWDVVVNTHFLPAR
jgi:hypothetical protein